MTGFPDPSLVVLVGASGSGKSTWAAAHFQPNEIVSLAQLRAAVGENRDDPTSTPMAYELLERIVDVRLERGLRVVVDTDGLDDGRRGRWQAAAQARSTPSFAVLFRTDVDICLSRNERRPHPQPASTIRRQAARAGEITPTIEAEGFEVREANDSRRG